MIPVSFHQGELVLLDHDLLFISDYRIRLQGIRLYIIQMPEITNEYNEQVLLVVKAVDESENLFIRVGLAVYGAWKMDLPWPESMNVLTIR